VAKLGRWVAKLLGRCAPACYGGGSLGSNPDISQKYKMGDIIKEVTIFNKYVTHNTVLCALRTFKF
jgi:hypothetical protein